MSVGAGRPNMPDAWKAMTGQPLSKPDSPEIPFTVGAPPCPGIVERNRDAKAEWDRIVPELVKTGLVRVVDLAPLTMYVIALARYFHAEEQIELEDRLGLGGVVVKSKNGFQQLSQWYVVSQKEQDRLDKFESKFGFNPAARARLRGMCSQLDMFGNDQLDAFQKAAPRAA